MLYPEFLRRFGASVRTKNILQPGEEKNPKKTARNARPHALPEKSEAPREFIRLDPWEAEYLFIQAARAREGIVETGRFHGGSTFVMACANADAPIHSIDLAPQDDAQLLSVLKQFDVGSNVDLIVGDSRKTRYDQIGAFDFLFIDGDHSYEGCFDDLNNWFPLLSPGGHVVLHDSYHGQPVMDAVADFCAQNDVYVVVPAYRTSNHWWHHAGSMAHFIKRR
ncbi:class I SAM-dependent methyltransferase [Hyphococcus sp.]|uniref:class I SAM-dependent methyltransferase n=1 Tax=Hyphococcus sp. TaxID=2038636 RepID=UPI0035C72D7B